MLHFTVCQDVSLNGTLRHNGTATIRCIFDNKSPFPVSWFLVGNNGESEMTRNCRIQPAGITILSETPNCEDNPSGPANYEFIINHLDISRDLNTSWFCRYTSDYYLNITFPDGMTLI